MKTNIYIYICLSVCVSIYLYTFMWLLPADGLCTEPGTLIYIESTRTLYMCVCVYIYDSLRRQVAAG